MFNRLRNLINQFVEGNVENEEERVHAQYLLAIMLLGFVSIFMGFFNIYTHWYKLAGITYVFGICCMIDVLLETRKSYKVKIFGRVAFVVEMMLMFIAFMIIGEPEGFSALWILIVPSCGFFLFRMKYGLIISGVLFMIVAFLSWIPLGNSLLQFEYTDTFLMRFPIVYLAFTGVGVLFEVVRLNSQHALEKQKEKFEYMYNHDNLTGLYNRYGYNSSIDEFINNRKDEGFAFAILDLDHFKNVNDRFGHLNGDIVLKEMAKRIEKMMNNHGIICRWGGEEFSILFNDVEIAQQKCKELLDIARTTPILLNEFSTIETFSLGLVLIKQGSKINVGDIVKEADDNLYFAKQNGRNQIKVTEYVYREHGVD